MSSHRYIVSARKYRPTLFEDVVGQSHITITLKNAIKNKKIAQSFLFCGPRGVGKTTCARILAKAINCKNQDSPEPCNECSSCTAFINNSSLSIYELDAASNNSVEDIRSLTQQIRYSPQDAKYKVYIIDEVHMLSNAAFNAFLKTLEEPPSFAIFILATTEKYKILPTILSRCQIYDFNRITVNDITKHLENIAKKEDTIFEKGALEIIAKKADGALRDALSMFDLMCAFDEENSITYKSTIETLHILDREYYLHIIRFLAQNDISELFNLIEEIVFNGYDLLQFIIGLAEHLRMILIIKQIKSSLSNEEVQSTASKPFNTLKKTITNDKSSLVTNSFLSELTEEFRQKLYQQTDFFSFQNVLDQLNILSECEFKFSRVHNKRLCLELTLINMTIDQLTKKKAFLPVKI